MSYLSETSKQVWAIATQHRPESSLPREPNNQRIGYKPESLGVPLVRIVSTEVERSATISNPNPDIDERSL